MRWEYKIVNGQFVETYESKTEVVTANIVDWMNELGGQGWEIIERNNARLGDVLHINLLCKRRL